MSLATNITDLATRIATEFKTIRTLITGSGTGGLSGLATTDKSSIIAAINEARAAATGTPADASETVKGIAEIATTGETTTGTDDVRIVTPKKLADKLTAWAQPLSTNLTNLASTASGAFGRTLLTSADAPSAKTSLGLATVATSGSAADLTGVLGTAQLPPLAINETFVVATQAAMLALTAERGDVAIRTDTSRSYILASDSPSTLADWKMLTASGDVLSVAGRTGAVTLTATDVGLTNVDNTSDVNKPVSTATTTQLNLKAPLASPTFTGTVSGVTKTHVGLGSVDNTADSAKPVSTAQQTALNLKANLASPAFTGTPTGITATHVGLGNVTNTSDANKPVSTAQQTALNLKADISSIYTRAELGDPTTDFTAAFVSALA